MCFDGSLSYQYPIGQIFFFFSLDLLDELKKVNDSYFITYVIRRQFQHNTNPIAKKKKMGISIYIETRNSY